MAKTAKNSNTLSDAEQRRIDSDDNARNNTAVGDPIVPFSTLTDVTDELNSVSQSIVFRSFAHSALFQAISLAGDLLVARSQPQQDELNIERLERRFHQQAGIYNFFKDEAATYAESKYEEVMDLGAMFDYVVAVAPKDPTRDLDQYDAAFLKSIGLTVEQAVEADKLEHAKAMATFQTRVEHLTDSRIWVQQAIESVGACTPDLPAGSAYRMLQKAELKLADEPARIWPRRDKIPGAFGRMAVITADLPKVAGAIKRLRDAFKGDSRVNIDD